MSIPGVTINGKNMRSVYGLTMEEFTIGMPTASTIKVSVPGRSGELDLTSRVYGSTPYTNRAISMTFGTADDITNETWAETLKKVLNDLHGIQCQIIFDDDNTYYYYGRISVESFTKDRIRREFKIKVDADPYKYLIADPTQKSL